MKLREASVSEDPVRLPVLMQLQLPVTQCLMVSMNTLIRSARAPQTSQGRCARDVVAHHRTDVQSAPWRDFITF